MRAARLRPDWTTRPVEWDAQVRCRLWASPDEVAGLRRELAEARAETARVAALLESLLDGENE